VVVARAISLEEGRYALLLSTPDQINAPPTLLVRDRRTGRSASAAFLVDNDGLRATFPVDTTGGFDLLLAGGEPFSVARARLLALR